LITCEYRSPCSYGAPALASAVVSGNLQTQQLKVQQTDRFAELLLEQVGHQRAMEEFQVKVAWL
jgi:hypothetical protein